MIDLQSVPKQQLQNPKFTDSANSAKLPQNTKLPEKKGIELPENENSRQLPAPPADPHPSTEHDTHGMEYLHRPAWLAVCLCSRPAPAQLLITST